MLISYTYFFLTVVTSESRCTLTGVVVTATHTSGIVETYVADAVVRRNVTCLPSEPIFTLTLKVILFVFASVAMTRVWVAVVCHYKGTNKDQV